MQKNKSIPCFNFGNYTLNFILYYYFFKYEFSGQIELETELALIKEWANIMGPQYEIVVAQMSKFKPNGGLGISLEGTVEKVDGAEQNPHHYIRSVLPDGPVGQNGRLQSGDELLEVNGRKLLGLYHTDVVSRLLTYILCIFCLARSQYITLPK